jgi:hypothetical protein
MDQDGRALAEALHREAAERARGQPLPPVERPTIHFTELPEAQPGEVLGQEWNTYRREVGWLLAEGYEGRFVLIKGQRIISMHDSWDAARDAGLRLYLLEPHLIHQVRANEPILRVRGYNLPLPVQCLAPSAFSTQA